MEKVDIKGFEGLYSVDISGRVWSKDKQKSPVSNGTGYLQVALWKNNKPTRKYVHRIVWETFKGEIPKNYEIDHKDENKANNALSNLHLVTRKENMNKCHNSNPHIKNNLKQY